MFVSSPTLSEPAPNAAAEENAGPGCERDAGGQHRGLGHEMRVPKPRLRSNRHADPSRRLIGALADRRASARELVRRHRADQHRGAAGVLAVGVETGARIDDRPRFDQDAFSDLARVEDHHILLDHDIVADRAGVNHGIAPDRDAMPDDRRVQVVGDVDGRPLAETALVSDRDRIPVGADRREPAEHEAGADRRAPEQARSFTAGARHAAEDGIDTREGQDQGRGIQGHQAAVAKGAIRSAAMRGAAAATFQLGDTLPKNRPSRMAVSPPTPISPADTPSIRLREMPIALATRPAVSATGMGKSARSIPPGWTGGSVSTITIASVILLPLVIGEVDMGREARDRSLRRP